MNYTDTHSQEWHDERKRIIGGSDSPVLLMGEDYPFAVTPFDIWAAKTGRAEPKVTTAAMARGTALEPIIADIYAAQTGQAVAVEEKLLTHPEYGYIGGHIDRWLVGSDGQADGVLEIKCPNIRTYNRIKRDGPELYYQIQLQHYLAVTGKTRGAFAIFNAEQWELQTFAAERDEEMIGLIIEADRDFWTHYVETDVAPERTDGICAEAVKALPKVKFETEIKTITSGDWEQALEEYRQAKEIAEDAAELERSAKERITALMDEHRAGIAEGFGARVYYREQAGRATLDKKALAAAHPEIDLTQFEKIGAPSKPLRVYFLTKSRED